jgi:hypothetical protein
VTKPKRYVVIIVDDETYRCDVYGYYRCEEVIVRGPFKDGICFQSNGNPKFFRGMKTAFKTQGKISMATDSNKSKKTWVSDPKSLADWGPFAHAYEVKMGWVEEEE